jgi:hypothetical protein
MAAPWLTTEDIDWNLERAVFNILVDQQPAGIALPRSADDVSEVVRSQPPTESGSLRSAPGTTRRHSDRLPTPCFCVRLASAASRSMPMPAQRGSVPEHYGVISCPRRRNRALPHCMAPLRMSPSPATRSAAALASTLANTALPVTG